MKPALNLVPEFAARSRLLPAQAGRLFRRTLFGLIAVGLSANAHAGAIDHLRTFATGTLSARGEFVQKVASRSQRVSPTNSGEFVFQRPGKFRWSYLKPYEQVIIADGQNLTIHDKDLNQVTIRKLDDALGETPAAILFGNNDLEKRFNLKEAGIRDGIEWLDAVPRSKDTTFERISIGFRQGELAAMELRDALGQTTMLNFSKLQRNPTLSPEAFRFTVPKGADVLRN